VSKRWMAAVGGGVTSVLAAVSGVAGNHLTHTAAWAWVAFGVTVTLGAILTGWLVLTADKAAPGSPVEAVDASAVRQVGPVTATGNGQAVGINYGSVNRGDPPR
jgi:hypothetical protein